MIPYRQFRRALLRLEMAVADFNETRASDVFIINFGPHFQAYQEDEFRRKTAILLDAMGELADRATVVWRWVAEPCETVDSLLYCCPNPDPHPNFFFCRTSGRFSAGRGRWTLLRHVGLNRPGIWFETVRGSTLYIMIPIARVPLDSALAYRLDSSVARFGDSDCDCGCGGGCKLSRQQGRCSAMSRLAAGGTKACGATPWLSTSSPTTRASSVPESASPAWNSLCP